MLRFLSYWMITSVFGEEHHFPKEEQSLISTEIRILANQTFGRHVKNLKVQSGIETLNGGLVVRGSAAKIFAVSKKDEEESKDIQIEIYHYIEDNTLRVNLVDPKTGEIRQKPYKYLRGG